MKFFLIAWIWSVCSGGQPEQTVLKGHLSPYKGEIVTLRSMEEYALYDTLAVDASGNFSYVPANGALRIYALTVSNHQPYRIPLYLGEGDQVSVHLELTSDTTVDVKFSGDRVAENTYMAAFDELENSRMGNAPEMQVLSFVDYKAKFDEKERELQDLLDRICDSEAKERFAREQHLWFQNRNVSYALLLFRRAREGKTVEDPDFTTFIKSLDLNNPEECDKYLIWQVIDWYQSQDPEYTWENRHVNYMNWLDRLVSNPEMKNVFATDQMEGVISGTKGLPLDTVLACYNRICTNDSLRQVVAEQYQEYLRAYGNLMPGKVAPDFEMFDMEGKTCRLSDLKGQYVFLDIWATWCHGCVMEIPYMEKLQEHFAGDKRIRLVSISWDYTREAWLDFLEKRPAAWPQYMVDRENMDVMMKEYRIMGIPRFMLLDPQGRIVSFDCARPSEPECVDLLEQVIKKF